MPITSYRLQELASNAIGIWNTFVLVGLRLILAGGALYAIPVVVCSVSRYVVARVAACSVCTFLVPGGGFELALRARCAVGATMPWFATATTSATVEASVAAIVAALIAALPKKIAAVIAAVIA